MDTKTDGPDQSPDGLDIHPRPKGIVRVNKKILAFAVGLVGLVLVAIMVGILTRKSATAPQQASGAANVNLEPAVKTGELIARDIPDGSLPERSRRASAAGGGTGAGVIDAPASSNAPTPATPPALPEGAGMPPGLAGANAGALGAPPLSPATQAGGKGPAARQAGAAAPIDREAERERRLQEEREDRLRQALEAGTSTQSAAGAGFGPPPSTTAGPSALAQLQALQTGRGGPQGLPPALGAGLAREEDDQNKQRRKEEFLRTMEDAPARNLVRSTRTAGISAFEVKAGWIIPATMQHGINSDLPGKLTALVSQNVFDTATGRHLLIPQGATLVGTYDSQVAYGQDGLLVVWSRIVFPDGSSVDLEGMGGTDESGYSGFRDRVDNHYGRIIGFGLLTSLFGAAYQISQNERQTVNGQQTPSQVAGGAVAQQLSQLGIEIARKNLRVQPTIEIRPGYQFNVRVDKDLVFSRAYMYGNAK